METRCFRLGEICTLRAGSAFNKKYQGLTEGDLPFIKVSDMNLQSNQFHIREANNWISRDAANEIGAKPFPAGTVVFAKIGEALKQNRLRLLIISTLIDNNMMGAIPNLDLVDARYLMLALSTAGLDRWATGTAMPYLTQGTLSRVPIELPDLRTQQKVAAVIAAYDELIENNLRRIEILEEMAQAIYREWFVNFRYPGHEADQLVDSSVGPIPKGWEVTRLGDRLEFAYGKALKERDRRGGNVAVYGSSGVVGWHDRALVEGPGIVVGRKGNVGAVHWSDGDFYPIDTTFFVRTDLPLEYVFRNLRDQNFINSDAAVPGLNRQQAYGNPLLVPGSDVLERYETVVKPLTALRRNLEQQNVNLRATRELLLPKLVSGEIDVSYLDIDTSWLTP